jgi:hypothetical protein
LLLDEPHPQDTSNAVKKPGPSQRLVDMANCLSKMKREVPDAWMRWPLGLFPKRMEQ